MRKSWKWALCLGAVSLLLLGGCGKEKTEPVDLVLVTDGSLFYPKFACSGVTLALACRPFAPDWRWQNA